VKRTEVTYGQLDRVLRSLGLSCRLVTLNVPALVYEHEKYGPLFTLPPFPESDKVLDYHLVGVRTMLDNYGIIDPTIFAAELQKTGRGCERLLRGSRWVASQAPARCTYVTSSSPISMMFPSKS
jgi:hypothetical protein